VNAVCCVLQVFYRERAVLMYTPLAFGFATLLAELPYIFAQTTIFVPIVSAATYTLAAADMYGRGIQQLIIHMLLAISVSITLNRQPVHIPLG
jgi:hypothetical protein